MSDVFFGVGAAIIAANGYSPVPLHYRQKRPIHSNWTDYQFRECDVTQYANAGIGIITANTPAIDIDVRDRAIAREIDECVRQKLRWPPVLFDLGLMMSPTRVGAAPKSLRPFQLEGEPFSKKFTRSYVLTGDDPRAPGYKPHRVEILAVGQQFVAHNIHPDTGLPYVWSDDDLLNIRREWLPLLSESDADSLIEEIDATLAKYGALYDPRRKRTRANKSAPEALAHNIKLGIARQTWNTHRDEVKAALTSLDPDIERDGWVRAGMALHHGSGGSEEGFILYDAWSSGALRGCQSAKYVGPSDCRACWNSFHHDVENPVTLSALFAMAKERAYSLPNAANTQTDVAVVSGSGVKLVCAASIQPEAIRWLWSGWLARGKLAILAGVAGTGKSTVAFNLAATVSTGGNWPDKSQCQSAGNILIWSGEDDPADTIIPRLMAAGADLNRVHIIRGGTSPNGEPLPFDPSHDVPKLRDEVKRIGGAALLIVDPIVSAVAGDMHKANEVRRSLQAVVDFAAEFDCAVIGISHFSKGSKGSSPQERVIGSQAFGALARLVLVCAKQDDSTTRVLARAKSNISIDSGGFSYSIVPFTLANGIETTKVEWGEVVEGSAREILGDIEDEAEPAGDLSDECALSMRLMLSDECSRPVEMLSKDVQAKLRSEGHSTKAVRTARKRLGVQHRRAGFGSDTKTFWRLPELSLVPSSPFVPIDAQKGKRAQVMSEGTNGEIENGGTPT